MVRINGEERNYTPNPSAMVEEARTRSMGARLEGRAEAHNRVVESGWATCKYACGYRSPSIARLRAHYASTHGEHVAPHNDAPYTSQDGKTFTNPATRAAYEASIHRLTHKCQKDGCPELFETDLALRAHMAGHGKKTPLRVQTAAQLQRASTFLQHPEASVNPNTVPSTPPQRPIRR